MIFNYKGITSDLEFGQQSISLLKNTIDTIYDYFDINDTFPKFKIIVRAYIQI